MNIPYDKLKIHKCSISDVEHIMELQKEIFEGLTNTEILRKNTIDTFTECAKTPNLTLGIWDADTLIAVAIFVDASGTEEDLSSDLVSCIPKKSANIKLVMVKEKYRGNNMQQIMMLILERYAFERGYTHLCTTVSEKNIYSLQNIIQVGYQFDHNAIKYGGLSRKVFVKDISSNKNFLVKKVLYSVANNFFNKTPSTSTIKTPIQKYYLQSEYALAGTGDILEYRLTNRAEKKLGILINNYVYFKKNQRFPFKSCIGKWKLYQVWFNLLILNSLNT